MTTIERLEATAAHTQRLLDAMGGSPAGWTFTGTVTEGDPEKSRCACGHTIRWEFHWVHDITQKSLITGSVCVETLPLLDPQVLKEMKDALKRAIEAKQEEARKALAASKEAVVASLREELRGLIQEQFGKDLELAATGAWLPAASYNNVQVSSYYRIELSRSKRLKSVHGQAECLRRAIAALRKRMVSP